MNTITLKDKANVDVVYTLSDVSNGIRTYLSQGSSLLDTRRLTLSLKVNGGANRVVGKLSIPSVVTPSATGVPVVAYTEVGSFDLSAVKAASLADADDFLAQFQSLIGTSAVEDLYLSGTIS